jgi:hypothetical protein
MVAGAAAPKGPVPGRRQQSPVCGASGRRLPLQSHPLPLGALGSGPPSDSGDDQATAAAAAAGDGAAGDTEPRLLVMQACQRPLMPAQQEDAVAHLGSAGPGPALRGAQFAALVQHNPAVAAELLALCADRCASPPAAGASPSAPHGRQRALLRALLLAAQGRRVRVPACAVRAVPHGHAVDGVCVGLHAAPVAARPCAGSLHLALPALHRRCSCEPIARLGGESEGGRPAATGRVARRVGAHWRRRR